MNVLHIYMEYLKFYNKKSNNPIKTEQNNGTFHQKKKYE